MIRFASLAGVFLVSFAPIVVRLADVPPATAAFYRLAYAVPLLFLMRPRRGNTSRRGILLGAAAGALLAIDLNVWHRAIDYIGAGLATTLGNAQVVIVAVVSPLLFGERPSKGAWVAIPTILGGLVLATGVGRADAYGANPEAGVVFGILTAFAYAAFLLLMRAAIATDGDPVRTMLHCVVSGTVVALILGVVDPAFVFRTSGEAQVWLVTLAVGAQVIAWLLIVRAMPHLSALETSIQLLLQPVLTLVWAMLIFTEIVSLTQGLGVLLVLTAVGLTIRNSPTAPNPTEA